MSDDGFSDFQKILSKIDVSQSDIKKALQAGADTYVNKLKPNIPSDPNAPMVKKYGQMRTNLTTEEDGQDVQVTFGDAFWWRFVEHGTVRQSAKNFARNTLTASFDAIDQVMADRILKEMGL